MCSGDSVLKLLFLLLQFDRDLSLSSDCDGAESEQTWEEEEEGDEGELAEILSSERDNEEEASGNISSEGEGEEEGEGVSSDVEASSDSEVQLTTNHKYRKHSTQQYFI